METVQATRASLWIETADSPGFPPLGEDVRVDVAIVGAGMVGVTAAVLLARGGASVAVLEAHEVGSGVTGYTTAKVTSLHGLTYDGLISSFGEHGARLYGEANQAGLERIARFVEEDGIACDFRRRAAYTYAEFGDDVSEVEREAEAAQRLGLPATFADTTPLPWEVAGAVRFDDQAEFHPRKYIAGLAALAEREGARVFEHTRVTGMGFRGPRHVKTELGARVFAEDVIVATHMPILDRGLFFARNSPERSYAISVEIEGAPPDGMFLSTESPSHTVRAHRFEEDARELLIVGGESHMTGHDHPTLPKVRRIEAWARERFPVRSFDRYWSAHDMMPVDGAPFVGRLTPVSRGLWTATGFKKWGLTNGTAAAIMLADAISGRQNEWLGTFSSTRFKPLASAKDMLKENADDGLRFFGDRVRSRASISLSDLARGEGRVARVEGEHVAAYRDDDGTVHTHSPVCTHLGCLVTFNDAERSWDCPCHGSRFDAVSGDVLEGPAVKALAKKPVD